MYKVSYSHSINKGKHLFWNIKTIYYKKIFGLSIPYSIKFGETKEFLELVRNNKKDEKRKNRKSRYRKK